MVDEQVPKPPSPADAETAIEASEKSQIGDSAASDDSDSDQSQRTHQLRQKEQPYGIKNMLEIAAGFSGPASMLNPEVGKAEAEAKVKISEHARDVNRHHIDAISREDERDHTRFMAELKIRKNQTWYILVFGTLIVTVILLSGLGLILFGPDERVQMGENILKIGITAILSFVGGFGLGRSSAKTRSN